MKRRASEVIRRGFDSMTANWPLLVIRIGEGIAMLAVIVGAVLAAVVPVVVSIVHSAQQLDRVDFDPDSPEAVASMIFTLVADHWGVILYLLLLATVLLTLILAIHSFVEGGTVRVFVDAERYAATKPVPRREDFRMFTSERWFAGGKAGWWPIFWIYNLAWSVGLLVMLIPFAAIALLVNFMQRSVAAIAVGCLIAVIGLFGIVLVAILTALWNQKAITICVARGLGAVASLRAARRELREDFSRHFVVAFVLTVLALGTAAFLSMLSFGATFGRHNAPMALMFAPMQMFSSLVHTVLSAAIGCWFIACFAALTTENRE